MRLAGPQGAIYLLSTRCWQAGRLISTHILNGSCAVDRGAETIAYPGLRAANGAGGAAVSRARQR